MSARQLAGIVMLVLALFAGLTIIGWRVDSEWQSRLDEMQRQRDAAQKRENNCYLILKQQPATCYHREDCKQ